MTATLVAKNLTAAHGERTLFADLDLVVAPGDVIGLVGVNGAGKSTLLRLLAGLDTPETGELRLSPPTAAVGHLPRSRSGVPKSPYGTSWPAGRASPPPRRRWTRRPRAWSTGPRARTTRTRRPWTSG